MSSIRLERRSPASLKNHMLSLSIYGTQPPETTFVESLERDGIHTPLVILNDGTIIAGHRRRQAAMILKLESVPCVVRLDLEDQPTVVDRMIISSNRDTRIRTGDILAKEAAALAEIESRNAAERNRQTRFTGLVVAAPTSALPSADSPVAQKSPKPPKPAKPQKRETRTVVADALGVGRNKAEQAIRVGAAIKEAELRGDVAVAEKLAETARTKSINAASKLLAPRKPPVKRDNGSAGHFDAGQQTEWRNSYGKLVRMSSDWLRLAGGNTNAEARTQSAGYEDCLSQLIKMWMEMNPLGRWC